MVRHTTDPPRTRTCKNRHMIEVRRTEDREVCGAIREVGDGWEACTIFGAVLAHGLTRSDATDYVLEHGLPVLSGLWTLTTPGEAEQLVRIIEASPSEVRLALGIYSLPGVETVTFTSADLETIASLRPAG